MPGKLGGEPTLINPGCGLIIKLVGYLLSFMVSFCILLNVLASVLIGSRTQAT